jgi:lysophospholipase L1-like esterase
MEPVVAGSVRALLVGDSVGWSLAMGWPQPSGVDLQAEILVGCGIQEGGIITAGRTLPTNDDCAAWRQRWSRAVAAADPDVVIVSIGAWEVEDQVLGGRRLRFPSPELDEHLGAQLADAIELLSATGARVAFLSTPCFNQHDDGVNTIGAERNEVARVAHFNGLLDDVVGRSGGKAIVVPLAELVCPDGRWIEEIDGVHLYFDGMHFTPEAARWVWTRVLPEIRALADRSLPLVPVDDLP